MTESTQQDQTIEQSDLRREPRQFDPDSVVFLDPLVAGGTAGDNDDHKGGDHKGGGDFLGLLLPRVSDESESGVGLVFDERPCFSVGDETLLTQNAITRQATVRNIRELEDGRFRLGLEWN